MKVTLKTGAELSPIMVFGERRFVQNENRDTLVFEFYADAGLEALDALFTAENCESITIEDNEGGKFIHTGYVVRAEIAQRPIETSPYHEETDPETGEITAHPAVYEDRIFVAMAERNTFEKQLAEATAALNILAGVNDDD